MKIIVVLITVALVACSGYESDGGYPTPLPVQEGVLVRLASHTPSCTGNGGYPTPLPVQEGVWEANLTYQEVSEVCELDTPSMSPNTLLTASWLSRNDFTFASQSAAPPFSFGQGSVALSCATIPGTLDDFSCVG